MTGAQQAKDGSGDEVTDTQGVAGAAELPLATPALLAAALSGLLCLSACGSDEGPTQPGSGLPDASPADASLGEQDPDSPDLKPRITLSRVDESMTEDTFRALCDEQSGSMELHAVCGGANTCRGMSYDIDTHVYTEHTCKGLNTCRGYSCVLPKAT